MKDRRSSTCVFGYLAHNASIHKLHKHKIYMDFTWVNTNLMELWESLFLALLPYGHIGAVQGSARLAWLEPAGSSRGGARVGIVTVHQLEAGLS